MVKAERARARALAGHIADGKMMTVMLNNAIPAINVKQA
jgi:hypothetical protein